VFRYKNPNIVDAFACPTPKTNRPSATVAINLFIRITAPLEIKIATSLLERHRK
jgi:hypothetical protein